MRASVAAIEAILRSPGVLGAGFIGADRTVLSSRLGASTDQLLQISAASRAIFRDVNPTHLDLRFSGGRVVLMPSADGLVLVKASASASAAELRALVTGIASSVETGGVAKAAPPATASTIDDTTEATAVLRAVVGALRRHLGGPVVRNDLRRNLPSEGPARAYLAAFAIGLDASLTPPTSAPPKGATQAIGVWAASVLADGQGIIPALAELSLRDIAGDRAPTLAPSGFFDPPPAPPIGAA